MAGTKEGKAVRTTKAQAGGVAPDLGVHGGAGDSGAGDGNRTRMTSLEAMLEASFVIVLGSSPRAWCKPVVA